MLDTPSQEQLIMVPTKLKNVSLGYYKLFTSSTNYHKPMIYRLNCKKNYSNKVIQRRKTFK